MLFVEKKLGHDCTWIDLDVDKIKTWKTFRMSMDWTRKLSSMLWIEMSVPTWTTTVKRNGHLHL